MIHDAREIDDGRIFESDICIVGAGAAGITLAITLARAGIDVCLVEGGGLTLEQESQSLYAGKNLGIEYPPLTGSRLRYFGGTTNHWGGTVRPFDAFEFEPHPWVPDSGWPIDRSDLDRYYDQAREILGLPYPHYRFDPSELDAQDQPPLLDPRSQDLETVIWRRTQPSPTRMGKKFREPIRKDARIHCFLNANAAEIEVNEAASAVETLRVIAANGRTLRFRSRGFVLAMGAIENARLLLLSDSRMKGGVGNQNDLVGRYFADHAFRTLGEILVTNTGGPTWYQEETFLLDYQGPGKPRDAIGYATTPKYRRENQLLGFSVIAHVFKRSWDEYRSAAGISELSSPADGEAERKSAAGVTRSIPLYLVGEKAPNPDSRVVLQDEKDALGLRKVAVDLQLLELDTRTIVQSSKQLGIAIGRTGRGRVRLNEYSVNPWSEGLGGHQTGTTRMADDPKRGVTDRDGRVHGIANLYVTGGSLYPTSGWQHPTLTIYALALRLADHLSARAKGA